jgi:hypothetical protein
VKTKPGTLTVLGFEFHQVGHQVWKSQELFAGRYATVRRSPKIGGYTASLHKPKGGQYKVKGTGGTPSEALTKLMECSADYHMQKMHEHLSLMNLAQSLLKPG